MTIVQLTLRYVTVSYVASFCIANIKAALMPTAALSDGRAAAQWRQGRLAHESSGVPTAVYI